MAAIDELVTSLVLHPSHSFLRNTRSAEKMSGSLGLAPNHALFIKSLEDCFQLPEIHGALHDFRSVPCKAKSGTRERLAENKMLHESFSAYWDLVHSSILKKIANSNITDSAKEAIKLTLDAFRRPHKYTFQAQQNAIRKAIAAREQLQLSATEVLLETPPQLSEPQPINSKALVKELEAKVKIKTRPEPSTIDTDTKGAENPLIAESTKLAPRCSHSITGLKAKTVDFFRQMFSCEEIQQQRDWDDLVVALVDAGCSAVHNGGSAATFEYQRNKKGSIVLHKPHPKTTIFPIMLRSIGHRLTKSLGWDADTFMAGGVEHSE